MNDCCKSNQMNNNDSIDTNLKKFYSSSQNYLERLKRHDKKTFVSYIELCKAEIVRGSAILDCGCGVGTSSYLLARCGFKVTAIDISPLFISEAKKMYGNQQNLRFFIEDTTNMSFSSCTFDAVCSFDLLEHVIDVKDVLGEMGRVTKVGGTLIIFMPNHIDPLQHLKACIRWRKRDKYKPWEAKSRIEAFWQFVRSTFLIIVKAVGINKKIYYLQPVLLDDKDVCGEDFDATWLTNWFDVKNILEKMGFSIREPYYQNFEDRILCILRWLRVPKVLQSFYIKMRASCVVVGVKNESTS